MKWTMNLGYKKGLRVLYIAHLSHNDQEELFLKFLMTTQKASQYYDGFKGTDEDISSIDHFSIHKDGSTHIRYYDRQKKPKVIPDNKLKPMREMPDAFYLPLFVLSLYDVESSWDSVGRSSPLEFKGYADIDFTWDIHDSTQFSVVFFLVGGNVNADRMLELHFPSVFDISDSPMLTNCFGNAMSIVMANQLIYQEDDLRLLLGFTKKVIPRRTPEDVVNPRKLGSLDRVVIPLGFFPTHSDERIRAMV